MPCPTYHGETPLPVDEISALINAPYQNAGNDLVLSLVPEGVRRVLDVGCGAGDNARRLADLRPGIAVVGVTHSAQEAEMAKPYFEAVHVFDLEQRDVSPLGGPFDLLLFSHVLEHLRDPVGVVRRLLTLLNSGGYVLIAVPNALEWRTRLKFLRGDFRYTEHGILDRTHLRFFTYDTAADELVAPLPELELQERKGRGAAPLGPLRRRLLTPGLRQRIDAEAVRLMPNLFAGEVALLARLRGAIAPLPSRA